MSNINTTDPVMLAITKANIQLMINNVFFGQLVSRMEVVLCDNDSWCYSAATDGKNIYFNREFTSNLSVDEIIFVLAHEVLHCLFDHLGRRQGRDPKLWNMANDYIVNYTLVQNEVGRMPSMGLYDERFTDEMSSEEVYAILKKNSVDIKMTLDQHLDENNFGEDEDGDGESDQGSGSGSGEDEGTGQGSEGSGSGNGQEVSVTVTGQNGPPKLSKEDLDELRTKMRAAAIQAVQQSGAGNVPAGILRRLGELIEPKMDWRSLLDSHLRSAIKDNYTFQRMSRHDFGGGFILPAQDIIEVVKVDIAVDTSGSMTETMLRDIFSEVKGIMQSFPDFLLRVWTFDTEVYGVTEFTPHNLNDIDNYAANAQGGGGTMFECNWTYMKQNDISPDRFVVFTDGYPCGTWGDADYCDTLFVVHGNMNIVAPFGQTAYYEEPALLQEAA